MRTRRLLTSVPYTTFARRPRLNTFLYSTPIKYSYPHARNISTLTLTELICHHRQNYIADDSIKLSVWGDDYTEESHKMGKGKTQHLGTHVNFTDKAQILLTEKNSLSPNTILTFDFKTVLESTNPDGQMFFNSNGASYELKYAVTPLPNKKMRTRLGYVAAQLELNSLVCFEKQNHLSKDEVMLSVESAKTGERQTFPAFMSGGDILKINRQVKFSGNVYLTLLKKQMELLNNFDSLGTQIIAPISVTNNILAFERGGGSYKLIYSIKLLANEGNDSPVHVVPKAVSQTAIPAINMWLGSFGPLYNVLNWQLKAEKAEATEVIEKGTITPNEWLDTTTVDSCDEAVVYYKNIPINASVLQPDTTYCFRTEYGPDKLHSDGYFRTLPASLPAGEENALDVVLGSCYDYTFDEGRVSSSFLKLYGNSLPHMKLFAGDQVYLDSPAPEFALARYSRAELTAMFHQRYHLTWRALRGMFARGNNYFTSDDHEYFNGYPYKPAFMMPPGPINASTQSYLDTWTQIAKKFFKSIQSQSIITIVNISDDLSFCLADTRIERGGSNQNRKNLVSDVDFQKISDWITKLKSPGILVIGQPVLDSRQAGTKWVNEETNITVYEQYQLLVQLIADSKQDIVLLTGDVHFSRLAHVSLSSKANFYEVISSPLSLVELTKEVGDAGRLHDSSEFYSQALGDFSDSDRPKVFPPDFIKTDKQRSVVDYKVVGRSTLADEAGKPIMKGKEPVQKRTVENFMRLRFFKPQSGSADITVKIDTHMPRVPDEQGKPKIDWQRTITLKARRS